MDEYTKINELKSDLGTTISIEDNKKIDFISEGQKLLNRVLDANEKDRSILMSRVFEHSVSDGLKLAEKFPYTNRQYFDVVSHFTFYIKHSDLANKIVKEAKLDIKSDEDREKLSSLEKLYEEYEKKLETGGYYKLFNIEKKERSSLDFKSTQVFDQIDDWYSQFIKKRSFDFEGENNSLSSGERLGLEAVETLEPLLQSLQSKGYVDSQDKPLSLVFLQKIKLAEKYLVEEINSLGGQIIFDEKNKEYKLNNEIKETQEGKYLTEEKILDKLDQFIKEGVDKYSIAQGLAGLDSDRAWQMRDQFIKDGVGKGFIAQGLAGLDSDRSWQMRDQFIKDGVGKGSIALGLAGDYMTFVWQLRNKGLYSSVDLERKIKLINILNTFYSFDVGNNDKISEEAKETQEGKYLTEEKILDKLDQFIKDGVGKGSIAQGLAGLDSDRAWQMRDQLIKEGVGKYYIALGLAGLDSDRAWQMRDQFIKEGVGKDSIAQGLAGLDSDKAWQMRDQFIKEGVGKGSIAQGLAGDYMTFVWQLNRKINNSDNNEQYVFGWRNKNFDEKELLGKITKYLGDFKENKDKHSQNRSILFAMNSLIKESPELFKETIGAIKDKKLTKTKLIRKLFPSVLTAEDKNIWRNFSGYFGFNLDNQFENEGDPKDYLNPDNLNEMLGGDPSASNAENVPKKEVFRLRESIDGILVTGIYGKLSGNLWDQSYQFPIAKETIQKGRETTITLPNIGNKVKLPKTLNSNITRERVKGTRNSEEFPLETEFSPMQEGIIRDTKKAQEIIYSLEIDQIPKVMINVGQNEYEIFRKRFVLTNNNEMTKKIVELPGEIDLFLESINNKEPKEKVLLIEEFVRSICHYDMKNGEMMAIKKGKSIEEKLDLMEARVEELKQNGQGNLSGKKYAGVCADFALLSTAILRQAGFISGILSGFKTEGLSAYSGDAHATSFVVWPNKNGGNEIYSIDGTPSGLGGISTLSLKEKEISRENIIKELEKNAEEDLAKILDVLNSYDSKAIGELTNGKIEAVLNTILQFGVSKDNLKTVTNTLNAYWYTPIKDLDLNNLDDKAEILRFFENEAKKGKDEIEEGSNIHQGTKLFETIENFIQRFSKSKNENRGKGFEVIENFSKLIDPILSKNEKNALVATVTYLKSKKMK